MKKLSVILPFLFSFALLINTSYAEGYRIEVKISNCSDTVIYLAHYFDGRVFADDTTALDQNGKGVFEKKKVLPQGIYVIYLPNQKYFDILIGADQKFSLEANASDFMTDMKITGAPETKAFYEFQQFMQLQNKRAKQLQEQSHKHKGDSVEMEKLRKAMQKKDIEVREYIGNLEKNFPSPLFVSQFAKLTIMPKTPDFSNDFPESDPDRTRKIQQKAYQFKKNHFFDNASFTDDRLLRTPIFKNKLEFFFDKVLLQHPDTIFNEAYKIIEQARPNEDFFKYLVQFTLNNAIKSKVMGMDAAFVNLARKYYLSGEASWADSTLMAKIRERVIKLQYNLIGLKAQDLKLETLDGEFVRLHEVNAPYTILYFWEPSCGHCKKTTPRLKKEIYDVYHAKGLEVFAVYTQDNKQEWENFIVENKLFDFINCYDPTYLSNFRIYYDVYSTPVLYLLDKDKKIIAKRIDIDTLKDFLDNELLAGK